MLPIEPYTAERVAAVAAAERRNSRRSRSRTQPVVRQLPVDMLLPGVFVMKRLATTSTLDGAVRGDFVLL